MIGNLWPIASINNWTENTRRMVHNHSGRREGKLSGRIGVSGEEFGFQIVLAGRRKAETIIRRQRSQMVQKVFSVGLAVLGVFLAVTLIEWPNIAICPQRSSDPAQSQYDARTRRINPRPFQ